MDRMPEVTTIGYKIAAWSSHSADFHPRNIMVNNPNEQSSRWSSERNDRMQFVTLELDQLSMIHSITFGKFSKVHVCNLKEFKIYGGMNQNNMIEIGHSGLQNDDQPENFPLRRKFCEVEFPCKFLKIVPLMAWGANFNFSIWFVELHGVTNPEQVHHYLNLYNKFRDREVTRLCLKHFRQRNYESAFEALSQQTNVSLEHETLTKLHEALVKDGDFEESEEVIRRAAKSGKFADYLGRCSYNPLWSKIQPVDSNGTISKDIPLQRGGHQMCIDNEDGLIYLIGGWDGERDLGDFWVYDINNNMWSCLSRDMRKDGGPSPRSCHKICYDSIKKQIYLLGRYMAPADRGRRQSLLLSDFYRYDVQKKAWTLISLDTGLDGGPSLIYDHQMEIDLKNSVIIIFGGRNVTVGEELSYSGMFYYHYDSEVWTMTNTGQVGNTKHGKLKSRIGHSMLLEEKSKNLYIFAGQHNRDYLSDFYVFNIASNTVVEVSNDTSKEGGPEASFTQRATIDSNLGEIYVLSGFISDKAGKKGTMTNCLWIYDIKRKTWEHVLDDTTGSDKEIEQPRPRYAHQFIYDKKNKMHYLFGGNSGHDHTSQRLNDFWKLDLRRPDDEEITRNALFLIRKQRFLEMCKVDRLVALQYLQTKLAECVDHSDSKQAKDFYSLTTNLFTNSSTQLYSQDSRTELYEALLDFFPAHMKQPQQNLIDLITMTREIDP